jgi:hypothetical protein
VTSFRPWPSSTTRPRRRPAGFTKTLRSQPSRRGRAAVTRRVRVRTEPWSRGVDASKGPLRNRLRRRRRPVPTLHIPNGSMV